MNRKDTKPKPREWWLIPTMDNKRGYHIAKDEKEGINYKGSVKVREVLDES